MEMKLILIGIFLVIALAPSTSAKKQVSSDELKQIIHQRSLAGVWYHQPSPFQRAGPEPQVDCLIRLYTGRFWLIDSYLQVINNVSSFLTCVKKCHQVAGCKAVNYIQELAYCELEAFGFVDDPEQLRGTMGELNEMGEPAHADLIDCKTLPPGPIEPQTTPPGSPQPASTTVPATTPEPATSTVPPTTKLPATTPQPTRPPTTPRLPPTTVIPEMYSCGKARYPPAISKSPSDPSIDGVEPVPHSWPWTVNILYNGRHRCTGSLLRVSNSKQQSDIVLTAASCLIGNNGAKLPVSGLRVILGSQRASQTVPGQITVGVNSFVQMPRFNTTYFERDVALIKLDTVVPFSSTILPACLAQEGEVFTVDRLCVVTGWGNSMSSSSENILYQLRIATYSASYCARQTVCRVPINNIPCFCGGTADGMGPAQFIDAGSPLTCLIDGNWEQTGVAATINEMSCLTMSTYAPNVFVRISNIRSWIEDTVDDLTSVYW